MKLPRWLPESVEGDTWLLVWDGLYLRELDGETDGRYRTPTKIS